LLKTSGLQPEDAAGHEHNPSWLSQATWAFIALGVLLRVFRYALNYPLWGDESYVAANLIGRGYLDLLRPLDFAQVCPLLFLWIEHAIVANAGFSEWSLRLFPMVCSVASVPLFAYTASRVVRGVPLLLAVAIFAISFHPVRHAAEVKPYASDLLVALGLLALALGWLKAQEHTGRLWLLVVLAPVAVAVSFPAIFVAGAVSLGLVVSVWKTKRWQAWLPLILFNLAAVGTFGGLQLIKFGAQNKWTLIGLQAYWASSFPPLGDPVKLLRWLVWVHTGTLFAYPGGGQGGASAPTFLLFLIGTVVLWRGRHRAVLVTCLAPFGLTLMAAALRRYPYGGEARQMQFVAPSICLLAGLGAATLLRVIPWPRARSWTLASGVALGIVAAAGMLVNDVARPYRYLQDHRAREFARRFWPEQARDAEVACLRWDFKILDPRSANLWAASYFCNQWIYLPPRRTGGPRWETISASHPLRCMLYNQTPVDEPAVAAWLTGMQSVFELRRCERIQMTFDHSRPAAGMWSLVMYEFVPRSRQNPPPIAGRTDPGIRGASAESLKLR
jgi:hypothetical protein